MKVIFAPTVRIRERR